MVTVKNGTIINMPTYLSDGRKAHPELTWMTIMFNKKEMSY